MTGVALEGGGARGAYHMGAMKALYENGYEFDGFAGTSIGAINAAILAQGDFDGLYELWEGLSAEALFNEPVVRLLKIGERSFTADFAANLAASLSEIHLGIRTDKMKEVIGEILDEPKLRARNIDFGLVTVCINELKPYQLTLEDIPDGELLSYLMASASFPGFKPEVIGKNAYLDGGLYNNCPIDMMLERGYDRVIAIRTRAPGLFRAIPKTNARITIISPTRELGNIMAFDNAQIRQNLKIGYYDALKMIRDLKGQYYYIEAESGLALGAHMMALNDDVVERFRYGFLLPDLPPKRLLLERILPDLGAFMKLKKDYNYDDLAIAILEAAAQEIGVDPFEVYPLKALCAMIAYAPPPGEAERRAALLGSGGKYQPVIRALGDSLARMVLNA